MSFINYLTTNQGTKKTLNWFIDPHEGNFKNHRELEKQQKRETIV